jgi:hypothetical protein
MPAEKFVTPIAECMYACLQQPNVSKDGQYESAFQIVLVLDSTNKAHHELLEHVRNLHCEGVKEKDKGKAKSKGHYPIRPHEDEAGNIIPDKYRVRFKTREDFADQIATFDAKGNRIFRDKNFIANGSRVRVSWSYKFYTQGSGGVSLFLNGVQVIELIEWQGHTADMLGFKEEEGYQDEGKTEIQTEAQEFLDFDEKKDEVTPDWVTDETKTD